MSGIYHEWNGTTLTITSDSGTSSADLQGAMGVRGPQGVAGEQYTPMAGIDYWTPEEQAAFNENFLAKTAPAGYGLGQDYRIISTREELDTMRGSGFFVASVGVVDDYSGWWGYHIEQNDGRFITQKVFTYNGNSKERTMWDGTWQPWVDTSPSAFAPSGYGIGGDAKYLVATDDLNSITQCGFYSYAYNGIPANGISISSPFQYVYHLSVSRDANGTIVQEITTCGTYDYDANYRVRRVKGFGAWSEWEYENPPMERNTEYRTVERHLGKPVYTYVWHYGYVPNSGHYDFEHGIANIDECIGVEVLNANYGVYTSSMSAYFTQTHVGFTTDWAMGGCEFIFKYTKN